MKRVLVAGILLVVAFAVGRPAVAQDAQQSQAMDSQAELQVDCQAQVIAELHAATDATDPNQEGHLRAADAYRQLAMLGEAC